MPFAAEATGRRLMATLRVVAVPRMLSTPGVFASCRGNTRAFAPVRARSVARLPPYHPDSPWTKGFTGSLVCRRATTTSVIAQYGRNRRRRFASNQAVFAATRFALGYGRLRPLCSVDAPSPAPDLGLRTSSPFIESCATTAVISSPWSVWCARVLARPGAYVLRTATRVRRWWR